MARPTSPFPGMDPWLERYWSSVHFTVIQECRRQLAGQLPAGLFSEVEETVYIVGAGDVPTILRPDVATLGLPGPDRPAAIRAAERPTSATVGSAVATPVRVRLSASAVRMTHVAIRSTRDDEPLVTAVEVLSPTNKRGRPARRQYERTRRAYHRASVNVVEVDLLRGGRHLIDVPLAGLAAAQRTPYKATVRRAAAAFGGDIEAEHYPLPLRDPLPTIRVPLRPGDDDVFLDLQGPVDVAYSLGRYDRRIDYARPPDPPLSADDVAWAAERVAAAVAPRTPAADR